MSARENPTTGGVRDGEAVSFWSRVAAGCRAVFVREHGFCPRCEGHGRIAIYDISDEYAVPCPACRPAEAERAANRRGWSFGGNAQAADTSERSVPARDEAKS